MRKQVALLTVIVLLVASPIGSSLIAAVPNGEANVDLAPDPGPSVATLPPAEQRAVLRLNNCLIDDLADPITDRTPTEVLVSRVVGTAPPGSTLPTIVRFARILLARLVYR